MKSNRRRSSAPRPRAVATALVVLALTALTTGCGASGGSGGTADSSEDGAGTPSSTAGAPAGAGSYGDLLDVCHDGADSVNPQQHGIANGMLNIGVATDRESQIRPGVNRETWDASEAFANWCNSHGGIGGLKINLVELSGKIFEVESAMSEACADAFAMVGGGFVQDNLMFSGKDASDFERCGLISMPAFSVSDKALSSPRVVAPITGSPDYMVTTALHDYQRLYPKESRSATIVYGDLPAMTTTRDKWDQALHASKVEVAGVVSYPPTGATDWTPTARQVIDSGGTTLIWVGEPSNAASLLAKLREQGWTGRALFETNMYDPLMFAAGPDVPEGSLVRAAIHPLEEAATSAATAQYLDSVHRVADSKTGPLGVTSTSAWLLFATAANQCAEANHGVLDRSCILERASAQDRWTAGGLQAPSDPATGDNAKPSPCNLLLQVHGGRFVRKYPTVGGQGDDSGGFHCPDDGLTPVGG